MRILYFVVVACLFAGFPLKAQDQDQPWVTEIVRINSTSIFFLDHEGRVGVAKFSPELELNVWDYYSKLKWENARHLAVGRNLSVVSGSATELTQAFDTDKDGTLDFYQDMIREWPGKAQGARISCGPIADSDGRLLFAVSPPPGINAQNAKPSAVYSWNPGGKALTRLAVSNLPIGEMTISESGMLAAWIKHPGYTEGYYIGITQVPEFNPSTPDAEAAEIPELTPNIIIPTEITGSKAIRQLCFFEENGQTKLLVTIPETKRLIEVIPELHDGGWGGLVTVRRKFDQPVFAAEAMDHGKILIGAADGFHSLAGGEGFRFSGLKIVEDGVEVKFSQPVDRGQIISPEGMLVSLIPLEGTIPDFEAPDPLIESDGKTVILSLPPLPKKVIIKIDTPDLKSEEGEPIAYPALYYTQKFD